MSKRFKIRFLRRRQTEAESIIWEKLRDRRLKGLKFKRQYPIGNYIVDFYCWEKKLVIEIDGDSHNKKDQVEMDHERDKSLHDTGNRILRFKNEYVIESIEGVLVQISEYL